MDRFFYAPPEAFSPSGQIVFPPEEAKHAVRVLRLQSGSIVTVVDGQGVGAQVQIEIVNRTQVYGRVISTRLNLGEPEHPLTIGLALLNHQRRFAFFLEKAVELGVTDIIPLMTERTESKHWRQDRAIQVMTAALKQCNRSRLPTLHPVTAFQKLVRPGILVADPESDVSLLSIVENIPDAVSILIGPEGGFTNRERALATERRAKLVRLGPRRLRAETAAICCASTVMLTRPSRNTSQSSP